jgi:predicted amidohydrolase
MNARVERAAVYIAQRALNWRASSQAIRQQLAHAVYTQAPAPEGKHVRLGVIQFQRRLFGRVSDYVAHLYALTRQAVEDGAQLVILPEDTGSYPLAGLIPGIELFVTKGGRAEASEAVQSGAAPVLALLRILTPVARRVYMTTFATLARSFGVHILAGNTLAMDQGDHVYKEVHLYGPDGMLLLVQRKTHLVAAEARWGLSFDREIHVAHTAVGVLAAPICMDHTFYEPIRIAWLQGAEIIIDPAADPARYNFWTQARGVWGRVQESPAYGVHALMVGRILGSEFGGRSGVYAPLALSPHGDGVLAQARTGDTEEVFCVTLDLEALRAYRREHAPDPNLSLYRRYLPAAYVQARAARANGRRVIA